MNEKNINSSLKHLSRTAQLHECEAAVEYFDIFNIFVAAAATFIIDDKISGQNEAPFKKRQNKM